MLNSYATIIGITAVVLVLMALAVGFVCFFRTHCNIFSNKNSERGFSDPSVLVTVEWDRIIQSNPDGRFRAHPSGPGEMRQFTIEELEDATKQFSERNLIGVGSFGLVYKGLLHDGTVVAIKRRPGPVQKEFVEEVVYLSEIRHRHLVTLLGYCQEGGSQMLIYEYLPNGSICAHLYDNGHDSATRLEFKQRLSIAMHAAKGLCHLHCLIPPCIHKNFKTANVLVDENFIAKVADAGVFELLERIQDAGTSSRVNGGSVFEDPGARKTGNVSKINDVYSFGVFLLELVTGWDMSRIDFSRYDESLTQLVETCLDSNDLVDGRLVGSFTLEGMKDLIRLTLSCMSLTAKERPSMDVVVLELERIHERETTVTTLMGEDNVAIALGSQLFTQG